MDGRADIGTLLKMTMLGEVPGSTNEAAWTFQCRSFLGLYYVLWFGYPVERKKGLSWKVQA